MNTTNYINTFITVAPDCPAKIGEVPPNPLSIAGLEYALLQERPYSLTSDDLQFAVHARRNRITGEADLARARAAFLAKPRACLRASPLAKRYGWGFHHDESGKVAIYAVDSGEYQRLASSKKLKVIAAVRSSRR
jgi:hypothetical protein